MNRRKTIFLTMLGMVVTAIVMTTSSPIPVLALGHWNLEDDQTVDSRLQDGIDNTGMDNINEDNGKDDPTATTDSDEDESSGDSGIDGNDSSQIAYEEFQGCLSDAEGLEEGSPTEEDVQGC
jgi:hypothetical protein